MIFAFSAVVIAFSAVFCGVMYRRNTSSDYGVACKFFGWVSITLIFVGFIVSGISWAIQTNDFEDMKKFQELERVYQSKAEILMNDFAGYLSEQYPEHERGIYDSISPDEVNVYLIVYPRLKSSDTLMVLVEQINQLQTDVYQQRIETEQLRKKIRFCSRNPWLFGFMIPKQ